VLPIIYIIWEILSIGKMEKYSIDTILLIARANAGKPPPITVGEAHIA
jgi:hypothetical protein